MTDTDWLGIEWMAAGMLLALIAAIVWFLSAVAKREEMLRQRED